MATDRFGGIIEEEQTTDRFGGIIGDPQAGPEGVSAEGIQYTPEQLREYGTISAPPPAGFQFLEDYVRPTAQAVGAGAGAIAGAGTTAVSGPGALLGGVAGGGLGFAIGDEVVDLIENWFYPEDRPPQPLALELQESAEDIRTGLTYELVGHTLIPGAKAIGKGAAWIGGKFTKPGAEKTAGEIIAAMTDKGPLVAKNWEEAQVLEAAMPGLKFDLAQLTGEPGIIKFVQEGTETSADIAARQAEKRVANTKAIQQFIKNSKKVGAGTRDIKAPLTKQQQLVKEAEELAKLNMEDQLATRRGLTDPKAIGQALREKMYIGEKAAREAASEKFAKVPEQELIVDDIYYELKKIMKPKHADEQSDKFPKILRSAIKTMEKGPAKETEGISKEVLKEAETFTPEYGVAGKQGPSERAEIIAASDKYSPAQARAKYDIGVKKAARLAKEGKFDESMLFGSENQKWREVAEILEGAPQFEFARKKATETFKPIKSLNDIQGLRSEILEDLRTAKDKGYPASYKARLNQAIDIIDKKLSLEEGGKELQKAQKFFREEVIEKYHKGTFKQIMRGEETIEDALISGKFFKPGAKGQEVAKDFNRVFKDDLGAKTALKDTIDQDFLNKVVSNKTGEINKGALQNWLKKHQYALKEYGLERDYDSFLKARKALDRAQQKSGEFDKSVASRVLNADVNDVVKKAFSTGSKKYAAKELMNDLKIGSITKGKAIKTKDGKIYSGKPFHGEIYNDIIEEKTRKHGPKEINKIMERLNPEDGYIDMNGKFISESQAKKLAAKTISEDKQALAGLQNAMIDEILTEAPLGEQEIGDLLTSKQMDAQLRKYDAAIREVFKREPQKVNAMLQVRRAVKRMELTTPLPRGADRVKGTLESMARNYGHSRKTAVSIAADMYNWIARRVGVKDVNNIVNRAILDPELAIHLKNMSKGGKPEKIGLPFINRLIATGLITMPIEED